MSRTVSWLPSRGSFEWRGCVLNRLGSKFPALALSLASSQGCRPCFLPSSPALLSSSFSSSSLSRDEEDGRGPIQNGAYPSPPTMLCGV
ncbi:hypothetical protein B296_00012693 [Ensete ventricosum]|uniref:Uncharacterized protein n=1 Tax=Ensete ventricosum TaxID=4639 RepID=A0A427AZM3_ENSVE|nr:hypothetical protein B296_00012693 [Ensete ventricosum]